jgi:hypothetical protein
VRGEIPLPLGVLPALLLYTYTRDISIDGPS